VRDGFTNASVVHLSAHVVNEANNEVTQRRFAAAANVARIHCELAITNARRRRRAPSG